MSMSVDRARRRRAAVRVRRHVHQAYAFRVDAAIRLNQAKPIPGLAPVLYEIRAECGPDALVAICPECCGVEVVG